MSAAAAGAVDLFVWPPRDPDAPVRADLPDAPGAAETASAAAETGWWGRAEADLLGVRSVSFARWARATGWTPDPLAAFCWRCADSVGPHEVDGAGCGTCRSRRLAWDRAVRLGVYEGGPRAAVMELKFGRWRRTGSELGAAMGGRLRELMDAGGFAADEVVIVPVPASWRRRMGRGIDHTAVLARAAGRRAGVRVVRALRRRHTPAQVGLSATARAENVRGAFLEGPGRRSLRSPEGVRAVAVLDDVRTTGATMTAACRFVRTLIGSGPEIWSLTALVATDRRGNGASGTGSGGWGGEEHEKIAKSFGLTV